MYQGLRSGCATTNCFCFCFCFDYQARLRDSGYVISLCYKYPLIRPLVSFLSSLRNLLLLHTEQKSNANLSEFYRTKILFIPLWGTDYAFHLHRRCPRPSAPFPPFPTSYRVVRHGRKIVVLSKTGPRPPASAEVLASIEAHGRKAKETAKSMAFITLGWWR